MRIALISPTFPPFPPPASLRTHGFATTWTDRGHDVTVITTEKAPKHRLMPKPSPGVRVIEVPVRIPGPLQSLRRAHEVPTDHRRGSVPPTAPAAPSEDRPDEERAGRRDRVPASLRRLRMRTGIYGGMRMPDLTDHWVRPAIRAAREAGPFELVVSSCGPYTAHRVAEALRRRGDAARWVADYRDLWTDNPAFCGLPVVRWYERWLEDHLMRRMDLITTVSEGLARALRHRTDVPVHIITNGAQAVPDLDPAPAFADDGFRRLVYTGTVYPEHQNLSILLAGLARLDRDDTTPERPLRLVVAGYDTEPWREVARQHGVDHLIEHHGFVDHATSLRMQRDAEALVVLDWDDPERGVLTSKIFEYIVAGPPILVVGGCGTEASPIVRLVTDTHRQLLRGTDAAEVARSLAGLGGPDATSTPAATRDATNGNDARLTRRLSRDRQAVCMLDLVETLQTGAVT